MPKRCGHAYLSVFCWYCVFFCFSLLFGLYGACRLVPHNFLLRHACLIQAFTRAGVFIPERAQCNDPWNAAHSVSAGGPRPSASMQCLFMGAPFSFAHCTPFTCTHPL